MESVWGEVIEVEDLTSLHSQTHIRRVSVIIREHRFVNDSVLLCYEKTHEFQVDVLEDGLEIIDFGPRYDHSCLNSANSDVSDDERLVVDSAQALEADSINVLSPEAPQRNCRRSPALEPSMALGTTGVRKSRDGRHKGKEKVKVFYAEAAKRPVERVGVEEGAGIRLLYV